LERSVFEAGVAESPSGGVGGIGSSSEALSESSKFRVKGDLIFRVRLFPDVDCLSMVVGTFVDEEPGDTWDVCSVNVFPSWVRIPIRNSSTAFRGSLFLSVRLSSSEISDLLRLTVSLESCSAVLRTSPEGPRFLDLESTCIDIVFRKERRFLRADQGLLNT
jgi:hypothetical protein